MHPILFEIGSFQVGTYALTAMLGLVAGLAIFAWLGGRAGHDRVTFVEIGLMAFVIAVLAAKAAGFVTSIEQLDWPHVKQAALGMLRYAGHFYAGFLAGVIYFVAAFRKRGIPLWTGLDCLAPALALAHAIGRIGCFFAGCCWGKACDLPWAVTFTDPRAGSDGVPLGVPLHPTQLYEAAAETAIFALLAWLHVRRPSFPGRTFLLYALLYGSWRFFVETLRDDPRGARYFGLSLSQGLALLSVLAAGLAFGVLLRRHRERGGRPARLDPSPVTAAAPARQAARGTRRQRRARKGR